MTQKRLLLILFLLLGGALVYSWYATPRQQRVAVPPRAVGKAETEKAVVKVENGVGLNFSGGEKLDFKEPQRDLFQVLYQAPKIAAKPVIVEPPVEIKPPPPPVLPPPVISRPVSVPSGPKPIPAMKVVGYLEKGPQRTVFLSSLQGDIYLVKRGDRFADDLLVRDLNAQQVVISRGQDDQGVRLQLGKAKTQRLPDVPIQADRPAPPPIIQTPPPKPKKPTPVPLTPGVNPIKVDP